MLQSVSVVGEYLHTETQLNGFDRSLNEDEKRGWSYTGEDFSITTTRCEQKVQSEKTLFQEGDLLTVSLNSNVSIHQCQSAGAEWS